MFESGEFVADYIDPVTPDQVQPNGVDLTLDQVYSQTEPGRLTLDGKHIGDRDAIDTSGEPLAFTLSPGGYIAQYAETVSIPPDHVGFIYPRSSLMRNSCMLNTAVWDAGYTGRGEGLLQVYHDISLEQGARIAQIVFSHADHATTYNGSYQHENLDSYLGTGQNR